MIVDRLTASRRIGANVARARRIHQATQGDLACEIHVNRTTIAHIERGKRLPSVCMLIRIAVALDSDLADLTKGVGRQ